MFLDARAKVGLMLPLDFRHVQQTIDHVFAATAARHARDCGRKDMVDCLLDMAEVEWEHESYFRSRVQEHFVGRRLPLWPQPPAKEMIRVSFERELMSLSHQNGSPYV